VSEWRTAPLASLAQAGPIGIAGGPFGSALGRKDYTSSGIPVIRGAQLSGRSRFTHDDLVFVSREKADRHRRNLAAPGDVVVTQRGTLGQVGIVPRDSPYERYLLSQSQMKITVDLELAVPEFIYYALRSPETVSRLGAHAMIAGVPHINLGILRGFEILVPSPATQRRVADVLSAFDELIEINHRRIELLEGLARSLYREWFVRFRAPSVASEPGAVPDGWESTDLGSIATWYSGGTPSTKNDAYWDGGMPWITSGCLRTVLLTESDRTLTSAGVAAGSRVVDRDAVLFVVRGMSLIREVRAGIAERALAFGQDCKALVAIDGVEPLFLAFTVLDRQTTMQGMVELAGHGTGKLSTDRIKALPVALPPLAVQQQFVNAVTPIRAGIAAAMEAARSLAHTRDLLLPRLVTGRLDIAELDLSGLIEGEEAG
jgi:type I restriction enzyme, S subunit